MRRIALVAAGDRRGRLPGRRAAGRHVRGRLFPQISYFDRSLVMTQGRAGPGARLGYFFTDHLAIEAEGAWVPAEAE